MTAVPVFSPSLAGRLIPLAAPEDQLRLLLAPNGLERQTDWDPVLFHRYGEIDPKKAIAKWEDDLARIAEAEIIVLGVPSDTGAGHRRGAFLGPVGIRSQFMTEKGLYGRLSERGVLDPGDIRVHSALLSDDLLNESTIRRIRKERWGAKGQEFALPVSPISMLQRALECIAQWNAGARVLILGGDHSFSKVPVHILATGASAVAGDLGIVHFDAHPDMAVSKEGVEHGHETWAAHANYLIGGNGRLQQLGIRATKRDGYWWESEFGINQFWASEIASSTAEDVIARLFENLRAAGVRRVYVSNDIDGIDPSYAGATGTPEREGLHPEFVARVIRALNQSADFDIVGADLMEVAPPLNNHVPGEPARTLRLAAYFAFLQIEALLGRPLDFENPFSIPEPAEDVGPRPFTAQGFFPWRIE